MDLKEIAKIVYLYCLPFRHKSKPIAYDTYDVCNMTIESVEKNLHYVDKKRLLVTAKILKNDAERLLSLLNE